MLIIDIMANSHEHIESESKPLKSGNSCASGHRVLEFRYLGLKFTEMDVSMGFEIQAVVGVKGQNRKR